MIKNRLLGVLLTAPIVLASGSASAADPVSGAGVFAARCAVCHGPEANGIPGSFPPLHSQIVSFGKTAEGREYLVMVVSAGLMGELKVAGGSYRGVMPAQSALSEVEVAAVLSFLVSDRGQDSAAPGVTAADVGAVRARHPDGTALDTHALRPSTP